MSINEHKNSYRKLFLFLLLVALSGPWYFDRVSVPMPYACSSAVRLDEDFCGIPSSGLRGVLFAFGGLFYAARELLAASMDSANWLRNFLVSLLLLLLILLPFFSTLFAMRPAENRRRQLFHMLILGVVAVGAGLFVSLPTISRLHWMLWGPLLYTCLVLSMLLLESLALWESRHPAYE